MVCYTPILVSLSAPGMGSVQTTEQILFLEFDLVGFHWLCIACMSGQSYQR